MRQSESDKFGTQKITHCNVVKSRYALESKRGCTTVIHTRYVYTHHATPTRSLMAWIATNQAGLAVAQCKFNLILGPEEELIAITKTLQNLRQTNGVWNSDKFIRVIFMIFQLFQLLFDFVSIHNIFKICFSRMSNKIKTLYAEPTENNFYVLKTNNQYVTVIKLCINLIKIPSNKTNIKIPKNLYCA